jgi:hypothetical protein
MMLKKYSEALSDTRIAVQMDPTYHKVSFSSCLSASVYLSRRMRIYLLYNMVVAIMILTNGIFIDHVK